MTMADFASRRLAKMQERAKAAAPKAEEPQQVTQQNGSEAEPSAEVKEPVSESKEGQTQEPEPQAEGKDVLSKVDVSELTDEDIAELAQKGKSGLLKRIAELTAKRKLAEEKASQLEAAIRQSQPKLEEKVENNPFASVETADELQNKYTEVGEVIEWAEDVLDRAENLGGDDVVANVDGKELTKAQVKEHLRRARKARDKFLPAQFKEIQAAEQRKQLKSAFEQKARQELPWLDGEDNDLRKTYEAMVKDPRLTDLAKAAPDIEPQLGYIIAHAANSIYGRRTIPLGEQKPSPKMTPPANPSISAAGPERGEPKEVKVAKEASGRLRESGSMSDFIALRTAQLSKRK